MNTMQQEFDAVVAHLYKQGRPSKNNKQCLYRNSGGLSCAVGCRIPDNVYDEDMDVITMADSTTVRSLVKYFGDVLPQEIVEYENMFSVLQNVHDTCSCGDDGKFDLNELSSWLCDVANEFNLTLNIPQQGV